MRKSIFILFLFCFMMLNDLSAKTSFTDNFFISPGITIGYTFGAGINYGYSLDAGLINTLRDNTNVRYGLSYYKYFVKMKKYTHRLRSFGMMGQTDFADVKVGWGRARNKWGWGERNRCITHGISYDVSFAVPTVYSPWVGVRHFVYERAGWAWFSHPYTSLYGKYKFDIYQNTPLKKNAASLIR